MENCKFEPPDLTAVIPIKNTIRDLEFLKDTILQSHIEHVRLVLICDGPDERINPLLQNLLNTVCSNCVLVKKIDCGNPGQSRNYGIQDVKSEWIAFWDSDDKPNVKNIVESVKANRNRDVLVGQFSTTGEINISYPAERKTTRLLQVAFNPGLWRIVMKREIVLFGFPPIRMGEDQVFLMRNDLFNKNLKICDEEFYTYSIRVKNQLTRNLSAIRELKSAIVYSVRVIARKPTWHLSLYLIMICRLTYTYIASNFRKVNYIE